MSSISMFRKSQRHTNNQINNSKLWQDIQNGQVKALSILFKKSYPWLFKYGFQIVPSPALVEDAIQDLFLTVWNKREYLSKPRSVKSYLIISLRRIVLRRLKKRRNRRKRNYSYQQLGSSVFLCIEDLIIDSEIDQHQKNKLQNAFEGLSARQKQAISLKYYEGLSSNEISAVMNINRQSVYNHLSTAICRMQDWMEMDR